MRDGFAFLVQVIEDAKAMEHKTVVDDFKNRGSHEQRNRSSRNGWRCWKGNAEAEEHQEEPKDERSTRTQMLIRSSTRNSLRKEEAEKAEKEAEKLRNERAEQKAEYEAQNAERIKLNWCYQLNRNGPEKRLLRCYLPGITADETVLTAKNATMQKTQQSAQSLIGLGKYSTNHAGR